MGQVTALALVLALLRTCLGLVHSDPQKPVWALCSNAQCVTTYYFSLSFETAVATDALLSMSFPAEFTASRLGTNNPQCYSVAGSVYTSVPCSVSAGNAVTWTLGSIVSGQQMILSVSGVHNPDSEGGTGSFQATQFQAGYPVDANNIFAQISIDKRAEVYQSASVSASNLVINLPAVYYFQLIPSVDIPAKARVKVTFPPAFSIGAWYWYPRSTYSQPIPASLAISRNAMTTPSSMLFKPQT